VKDEVKHDVPGKEDDVYVALYAKAG